jgi:hypothetical protein
MFALAYLEIRFALHQVEAITRSPLRLAIWIPYAISLLALIVARTAGMHSSFGTIQLEDERLTGIGGLYVGALGITIALAAGGRVSAFRSTAEAILFSNAGVPPILMAVWLQIRKLLASSLRWAAALIYYYLVFFPRHASPREAATAFLTSLVAVGLLMSSELPIFLLSRGRFNFPLRFTGWTVAAVGFAFAAIGFSGRRLWSVAIAYAHCDPGRAVRSIQSGSPNALTFFGALLAVLLLTIAVLGRDALPELYAVSQRSLASVRRRRSSVRQTRYGAAISTPVSQIPLGALALAWKDWVGFRRGHGTFTLWTVGCVVWAICGVGSAVASTAMDDPAPMQSLFAGAALFLLFIAPSGASTGLSGDLGKPLFWLGADSLRTRLASWTLGRALRGGLALALAPVCAALMLGKPFFALAAIPICLGAYWSLQALGIFLYALFPNPIDARGPLGLMRTIATVGYAVPGLLVGGLAISLSGNSVAGVAVACVILVIQGFGLLEFAKDRFREHGAALAAVAVSA